MSTMTCIQIDNERKENILSIILMLVNNLPFCMDARNDFVQKAEESTESEDSQFQYNSLLNPNEIMREDILKIIDHILNVEHFSTT